MSEAVSVEPGPHAYTCEGCGTSWWGSAQGAYDAGWDIPPWFTTHVTCGNCGIEKTAWWIIATGGKV